MVQTIERCDRILRIAAQAEEGMKLADAAEQTGLKYTTVYNLAASLVQCGMLEKRNGLYHPGSALGELNALRRERLYLEHVRAEIIRLSRFSKPHSFVYSVSRGTQIHALLWKEIAETEPRRVLQFLPPLNSVAGLVMLAFLPPREAKIMLDAHMEDRFFKNEWSGSEEKLKTCVAQVRENGFSELPFEAPGTQRIAVPVFGDGKFLGALTWTRRSDDYSEREAMIPHLLSLRDIQTENNLSEAEFQA